MLDFAQDRRLRAALDDAPFVFRDRTEGAAAEAAAHDVDGKADHFPGRNMGFAIAGMGRARIRHVVDAIHLVHGQRQRRRVEPDVALAVGLHHGPCIARVRFEVEHARSVGVHDGVGRHRFVRWQADHGLVVLFLGHGEAFFAAHDADRLDDFGRRLRIVRRAAFLVFLGHRVGVGMGVDLARHVHARAVVHAPVRAWQPARRHHEGRAAQVADILDRFAGREAVGQVDEGPFGIAEDEQVCFRVGQHGAAHLVGPVVVMGDAAQRRFDRADHHWHVGKRFAGALGVDGDGTVGALVRFRVRGVGVVGADLAVGRVTVDHGIHIAGRDAKIQARLAQGAERFGRQPVGLGDDADAVALGFEQAAHEGHAEARVVDIGVAGDEDDVARVPAERVHFGTRHRQERRSSSAARPLRDGRKQVCWGVHWAVLYRKTPAMPAARAISEARH
jgi:hypothetical protein